MCDDQQQQQPERSDNRHKRRLDMTQAYQVRGLQERDLPTVLQIQQECFDATTLESPQSFQAKLNASPETCFVAAHGPQVIGYLIALPADSTNPPPLNGDDCHLPQEPDCLYLHDLSVSPSARGRGVAEALIAAFFARLTQLQLTQARLTAVNSSSSYWSRYGFQPALLSDLAGCQLATYGIGAQYMVRRMRLNNEQ